MELKPITETASCCSNSKPSPSRQSETRSERIKPLEAGLFAAVLAAWWLIYQGLLPMAPT